MASQPKQNYPIIEVSGTFSPNPLSASLPAGSTVTMNLKLTLRNSKTPFTFHIPGSYLDGRKHYICGFHFENTTTKEQVSDCTMACLFKVAGPAIDPEKDLLELLPDIAVPYSFESEVRIHTVPSGQKQPYIFGARLSSMFPGETYQMVSGGGGGVRSVWWCYWGSLADAKREKFPPYDPSDGLRHVFRGSLEDEPGWDDIPPLRVKEGIKFSIVE